MYTDIFGSRLLSSKISSAIVKEALEEAVAKNYELCDMNFMEMLTNEIEVCKAEGAETQGATQVSAARESCSRGRRSQGAHRSPGTAACSVRGKKVQ